MNLNSETKKPYLIVSHRGAWKEAPENSLIAFEKALESPIFGIEFDVQLTKDEVPVIYHDRTLQKITGKRKALRDCTYVELQTFDWGNWFSPRFKGTPCLSLETLLRRFSGKTVLFMEIKSRKQDRDSGKSRRLVIKIFEQLQKFGAPLQLQNLFILSFDLNVLQLSYQFSKEPKYFWNMDYPEISLLKEKQNTGFLSGFGVPVKSITSDLLRKAHQSEKKVLTYACNIPRQVHKAIDLKADYILTDKPRWLCEYLDHQNLTP